MTTLFADPRAVLLLTLGPVLAAGCGEDAPADRNAPDPGSLATLFETARLIELTHPFENETLVWPTSEPFRFDTLTHGVTNAGYYYSARRFSGPEHGGTHLDAPVHFHEGGWGVHEIPLRRLMGPGVVVDVSDRASAEPSYLVTAEDLQAWEAEHGSIPAGAFVLLFTDRSRLWEDAEAYMGTARRGEAALAELEFPGLAPDAARWLVEERDISAVGIDTPSIDHGPSTLFETHRILSAANVFALENVAHLGALPPSGALILALPMLLEDGTGGPVRLIGVVE